MTFLKFKEELNPELQMNYLTHHSKYKSTPKWKDLFRLTQKRTNQTNLTSTNRKQQRPVKSDALVNQVTIIDKPWSSLTEDDFNNSSEETRHALLEKHVQHFKDEQYCALLTYSNPLMMSDKLLIRIINLYIKAGIQPCIALTGIFTDLVSLDLFKLYSEDDRLYFFLQKYSRVHQPHDFLQYLSMGKIPSKILEDIANKSPTDFINISWNNMTPEKFKTQINPFMQLEYLTKFGPNYYTTEKYKQLYKLITNPLVLKSPMYKSLKFESDVPITLNIKECMKKYSINDIVDIALKKFGGNRNSYLKMTHDALCNLIEKKHVIIQTKKIPVNTHNIIHDTYYSIDFEKQIEYVKSLDPETKKQLRRYTYRFDMQ